MKKSIGLVVTLTLVLLTMILVGCTTAETTTITQTSPPTIVTITVTAQPPNTSPPTMTAGALAVLGAKVYSNNCDVDYCHAAWSEPSSSGTGGKAYFAVRNLAIFKTAQGFYTFIKYYMPNNYPGSISAEELLQVTAFMLTELGKVSPDALFGLGNLDSFTIE